MTVRQTGKWYRHTIVEIMDKGDAVGFMYEDRTWEWIPRPPILIAVGDRVAVYKTTPYGYAIRFTIGEMEVPTSYGLHLMRKYGLL